MSTITYCCRCGDIKAGWRGRFCRRSRANSCEPAQLLGSWQWAVRPDMSRPNPAGLIYQPPSFGLLSTSCQAQLSLPGGSLPLQDVETMSYADRSQRALRCFGGT